MKAQLFEVRHVTRYKYATPVTLGQHLLRLTPRTLPRQVPSEHRIELEPQATCRSRTDYFGNTVHFVTVETLHAVFEITATSRVAVGPASVPDPTETPPWEVVRMLGRTDRSLPALEASEFVFPSPLVGPSPAFADYARPSFDAERPVLDAVGDLSRRIHEDFRFDSKATTIATPLAEVLERRRGVCQDFAHLALACLRSLGLPARYVSGYLETVPPAGSEKLVGADASHAWIAFYCPGLGWIDVDPTNNLFPSMRHVTLAWGRDYSDVSPVRGVLVGGAEHRLGVAVDVTPLGTTSLLG